MPVKESGAGAGENNPGGQIDLAAFEQKIAGLINSTVNGALKNFEKDLTKKFQPAKDPEPDPQGGDPKPGAGDIKDPAINAKLQLLERTIQQLEKKAKDAETREQAATQARLENERVTAVKEVLNGIPFREQSYRDLFFNSVVGSIKRDQDGNLIAESQNGPLPVKDFLTAEVEKFGLLLQPSGASGAGASAGTRVGGKRFTMADLEPQRYNSLKPEEQKALHEAVLSGQVTA